MPKKVQPKKLAKTAKKAAKVISKSKQKHASTISKQASAASSSIKKDVTEKLVNKYWKEWYLKGLMDFIRVPNLTPMVDSAYKTNGLLERAIELIDDYVK